MPRDTGLLATPKSHYMKQAQPPHHAHHSVAPQDLDEYAECDVIIVGAGSAGALRRALLVW